MWDALAAADRETIAALEKTLRLPPGGWVNVPMLRQMATTLAAIRLTANTPQLSESDSFAAAFSELGIEDEGDAATRPSDSMVRLLREWRNPRNKKPAQAKSDPLALQA